MATEDKKRNKKRATLPCAFRQLSQTLDNADVLLIVPPFQPLESPSMAVHLLKACGQDAGISVQILYANLLLASMIGEEAYAKICDAPIGSFAGERFFARQAFGLPHLGRRTGRMFEPDWVIGPNQDWEISPDFDCHDCREPIALQELRRLEKLVGRYLDAVAGAVSERSYRIVGCSTTFEQTVASIALLKRCKDLNEKTITILGGANCDGDMARGIASLGSAVDYIFSGESEVTFIRFVRTILGGLQPRTRIIVGEPCKDMDALPVHTYADFYEQRRRFLYAGRLPPPVSTIFFQTSRGCWWGQKHRCNFCGTSEERIEFRATSPDRVIRDLKILLDAHPVTNIVMTDDVMPSEYFDTLLPRLRREFRDIFLLRTETQPVAVAARRP